LTDKDLLYVTTVAELGSITKAAQRLFIAQPSLSQTIRRIESELGMPLFTRVGSGVMLTEGGKKYVETAYRILKLYRDLSADIDQLSQSKQQRLIVGFPSFLGSTVFPQVMVRFADLHPQVHVDIYETAGTSELEQLILRGQIDLGFTHISKRTEGIHYSPFFRDPMLVAICSKHPLAALTHRRASPGAEFASISLNDLAGEDFILPELYTPYRSLVDKACSDAGFDPSAKFTAWNLETMVSLAALGLGHAFVPRSYAFLYKNNPEPFYFSLGDGSALSWEFCALSARQFPTNKASSDFITVTKNVFQDLLTLPTL